VLVALEVLTDAIDCVGALFAVVDDAGGSGTARRSAGERADEDRHADADGDDRASDQLALRAVGPGVLRNASRMNRTVGRPAPV
jgi:hypothetical protein